MSLALCLIVILQFWLSAAINLVGRNNTSGFVSVQDGRFHLDGKQVDISMFQSLLADVAHSIFRFYGTNAYWLQMTTDSDMDLTFHDIATANFRVVRTWAFNDVPSKPSSGTYFQVLLNRPLFVSPSLIR
jgi:mannan endo-1,4-beta-mannosidase